MKVKFMPSGEEHDIDFNETILHLAHREGLHIQSVCKGIPSCAECRVQILEGEHHVLPPSKKELDLIGTAHYVDMSRLACQLRCFGDVVVDLSEQIEKEKRAQEKPRDRMARRDGKESKAVLGGILDNVVAEDVELPEELEPKVEKVKVEAVSGAPNLDGRDRFYGDFYNGEKKSQSRSRGGDSSRKNKNNRQGNNSRNGSGEASATASGGDSGSKKRRPRRRNKSRSKGAGKPAGS
jgi:ferredoxin